MSEAQSAISRTWRKLVNAFGIGIVRVVDDSGPVQEVQVTVGWSDIHDRTQVAYHFGFAASPPPGTRAVLNFIGGERSRGIVVGTNHPASRPRNLAAGEAMLYDAAGNHLYLKAGGTLEIIAATKVHMTTPLLEVAGNITATGDITAGTVSLQNHVTTEVTTGTGLSGPPQH